MKILCITHADFESPGVIESWAQKRGYDFLICCPYKRNLLPPYNEFDFLIIMGGPQSPLELEKAPYLRDEIVLIQQAIEQNKLVLGFCLGAQLIGEALGGKTMRSPEKEVGVYPLMLTKEGLKDDLLQGSPQSFPVIHWHNDMPGMTEESRVLAYSKGCPRQVIRYKSGVYGFQCHLEITLDGMRGMIEAVPGDLAPSQYTQNADELLRQDYLSINQRMEYILDRLIALGENLNEKVAI
ncbi:MAG: homoserine O-succinyltransferase [Proteobacteria bacterium]|nr:homoserine O-succinyltransferase [Pseudomonadota bacterium]